MVGSFTTRGSPASVAFKFVRKLKFTVGIGEPGSRMTPTDPAGTAYVLSPCARRTGKVSPTSCEPMMVKGSKTR